MKSQNFEFIKHNTTSDPAFINRKYKHLKNEYIFQKY